MSRLLSVLSALLIAGVSLPAMADPFLVTYEAPTVQNTTATFNYVGVETFTNQSSGTFSTTFNTQGSATVITGTYSGIVISQADQYGGAGGSGNYGVTFSADGYSLSLSATNGATINYFGFWLSALDSSNQVTFYRGNEVVYSFSVTDLITLIGNCSGGQNPYCGNPTGTYSGQDSTQAFVFLNFYDLSGAGFDKVVFSEPVQGGFESDNQTVGYYTTISGTPVSEPAMFALFGGAVMALGIIRRRKSPR